MEESPSSASDFSTSTKYMVCQTICFLYHMVTGKIDAREGKRKMKQTCKKTDVKTKPYPERSKEKSSEAEITKSAAVSGT